MTLQVMKASDYVCGMGGWETQVRLFGIRTWMNPLDIEALALKVEGEATVVIEGMEDHLNWLLYMLRESEQEVDYGILP